MPGRALTIGTFDGVHAGHRALLARARELVGPGGVVTAVFLDPHPLSVLAPAREPARLSTREQRATWLREAGADEALPLEPTREVLALSPERFVEQMVDRHRPDHVVEGDDFRFGAKRAGDHATLVELGERLGFEAHRVDEVDVVLDDHAVVRASASLCRWMLSQGRVRDAELILGRPYELTGTVVRGDRIGRTIGVPTANLETENMLPADGVYAGTAELPGGAVRWAAIHVGPRAVLGDTRRTIETHVLDWDGPGEDEYGWTLRVRPARYLRDQMRFGSLDALKAQIRRDLERTRATAGEVGAGEEVCA